MSDNDRLPPPLTDEELKLLGLPPADADWETAWQYHERRRRELASAEPEQVRRERDAGWTQGAWFDAVEEAQLRRLIYEAYGLRGKPGFAEAIRAIEDWQWQTAPERLERHR